MKATKIVLVLSVLLIVCSCKSKKNQTTASITLQTMEKYWGAQFYSDYLEARGKASLTTNGRTNNVSMHLKMKMDSLVWGKFSLFGIGATVLITKDSFFMINTLSQEYMAYDNSYLTQYLGFEADIRQVQNLLLGNAILDRGLYKMSDTASLIIGSEGVASNLIYINKQNRTLSSKVRTNIPTQTADIQYSDYEMLDEKLLPKIVSINVKNGSQNLDVVLNYQNINSNTIGNFPFKIPNGFTKK